MVVEALRACCNDSARALRWSGFTRATTKRREYSQTPQRSSTLCACHTTGICVGTRCTTTLRPIAAYTAPTAGTMPPMYSQVLSSSSRATISAKSDSSATKFHICREKKKGLTNASPQNIVIRKLLSNYKDIIHVETECT